MEDYAEARDQRVNAILGSLGAIGHYLHCHRGGRSGRGHILYFLDRCGGSSPQRAIGENFGLKPGTLSELLGKMQADGLVVRTRDEGDTRKLTVRLTDAGREQAQTEAREREEFRSKCLACLDDAEQAELEDMLKRICDLWRTFDD